MRKIGLVIPGQPYSLPQILDMAPRAEAAGVDTIWVAEDYWTGRDGLSVLACLALRTERVRLGSGVVNPYNRHPVLTAMTFNTLTEIAPGRLALGIGSGLPWKPIIDEALERRPPLQAMREAVTLCRSLLSGGEAMWNHDRVNLQVRRPCFDGVPAPWSAGMPIYMAAMGPKMIELAGEISDGLLISTGTGAYDIEPRVKIYREAAERAGRDARSLEFGALITAGCSANGEIHPNILGYAVRSVSRMKDADAEKLGFPMDRVEAIRADQAEGRCKEAARRLTPEMISTFVVAGTVADGLRTLDQFTAAGADTPVLMPFGGDIDGLLELAAAYSRLPAKES